MKGRPHVLVLLVGLALAPSPVRPQMAVPPEQVAAAEEVAVSEMPKVLDQIVVTARQREEDLQEVPMAVTALNSAQVEEARIETPEDFVALVPNLSMASSFTVGNSLLTMRGISQINNSDSPVAVVVDGVYQGNQKQFVQELFDIERIEVMRGPQGALYGRNSLGGAINIITRQPGNDFRGSVRASAGNGSALGLMASVSGAFVNDVLQMSFAGSYKESDGLRQNVYLQRKNDPYEDTAARLQLRWLPADRSWFDLRIATAKTVGGAVAYSIFPTVGLANDFRYDPDESILGFSRRDMDDLSLRFVREGGSWIFTSITGANELAESYRGDGDFSNPTRKDLVFPFGQLGQGQNLDVRLLSQEFRLTSADGGDFEWMAGAYVQETDRRLDSFAFLDTNGTVAGFVPFLAVAEGNDNTANALFGRLGGRLGERWAFAVGLRFDRDRRRQKDLGSGRKRDATFDDWQPQLTLSYGAGERVMYYLNASRGFRAGGFNAPAVTPQVFGQESADSFEAGIKSTWLQHRLRCNGAVYVNRVEGFQYFQFDISRGGQIIDNIRQVTIRGLELEFQGRLRGGWEVHAAFGLNDSEVRDFDGSGRFEGNQTPGNTRAKLTMGTQYAHRLGDTFLATVRVDLEHRDRQFWHLDNLDIQEPIDLLNLHFGLEAERWGVMAWAKNLLDERYYTEYADAAWTGVLAGGDLGQLGRPRSYGVEVRRRF